MGLRVERIPTLGDNYTYLIVCEATGEGAVVDAPEAEPVIRRVEAVGCKLTKILSTHHHWDHSGANPELAKQYDAPVFGHASDDGRIPALSDGLEEGDTVSVGEQVARVIFIPAHTRGHIAYVFDEARAVFCGDTLFAAGCGRLFEGNPQMMHEALNLKLSRLPDQTRVYCGHEYTESNLRFALSVEPNNAATQKKMEWVRARRAKAASDWHDATEAEFSIPSTIGDEKATNPFMRVDSPAIIESVRKAHPASDADPVTILGHIRAMKDSF